MEKFNCPATGEKNMSKLGLKILDRYIIKKFLGTYFFSIILIVSIAVVFDIAERLHRFIENEAPLEEIVFDYYMNFIPYFAILFSSLFTFIAVIYFTSKMAYNSEIIAILSSGVSFRRLMVPYLISAAVISLFSFLMTDQVLPDANQQRLAFEEVYFRDTPQRFGERDIHKQISPGVYIYLSSYSFSSDIAYNFSMEKFEDGRLASKLISDYARWDSTSGKWELRNYFIRHYDGDKGERIEHGRDLDTLLALSPEDFRLRDRFVEAMSLRELDEFIEEKKMRGDENIEFYLIERYSRIAFPFSTFILTVIGMTLSSRKVKEGTGFHIGLGIFLSFTYILFMRFTEMFSVSGVFSPAVAVWLPNILYAFIGYMLYRLVPK